MANYLITHYKGKYRIKCEYDKKTNQFSRKLDGTYEDVDCYIDCHKNIRIFYYGKSILEAYVPSVGRGNNIVRQIQDEFGAGTVFNVTRTDSEILFQFKASNIDKLEKYLKPKTSGAHISPFSSKNLPKNRSYSIPDKELMAYKDIVEKLGKNRIIELTHMTNNYLKSLATKRKKWDDIKAEMALMGLSGKNYIHAIGKWDDYTEYLRKEMFSC